jgi:hypothetical protein
MKGQMMFQFIIAAVMFFAVVLYTVNYLSTAVSAVSEDYHSGSLQIKAVQMSEIIVKSQGEWTGGVPDIIGLVLDSGSSVLSNQKISDLETYCISNYNDIHDKLDLKSNNMLINISNGEVHVMECGDPAGLPTGDTIANMRRFALSESNNILTVDVWVW